MGNKHTPGPWKRSGVWIYSPNDRPIAAAPGKRRGEPFASASRDECAKSERSPEEVEANINLITAAPDLYEACRQMVAALREIGNGPGLIAPHGDALDAGLAALSRASSAGVPSGRRGEGR